MDALKMEWNLCEQTSTEAWYDLEIYLTSGKRFWWSGCSLKAVIWYYKYDGESLLTLNTKLKQNSNTFCAFQEC
jgi:hypothetical protein